MNAKYAEDAKDAKKASKQTYLATKASLTVLNRHG